MEGAGGEAGSDTEKKLERIEEKTEGDRRTQGHGQTGWGAAP